MMTITKYIKDTFILCLIFFLIFIYSLNKLFAEEINWVEVANTGKEIQFIDPNSIKYNNKGFLSVITKYSEINQEDDKFINTNSYLLAVDCESRLFSKLTVNSQLKQVKNWQEPTNDILIKKTIITSCSY